MKLSRTLKNAGKGHPQKIVSISARGIEKKSENGPKVSFRWWGWGERWMMGETEKWREKADSKIIQGPVGRRKDERGGWRKKECSDFDKLALLFFGVSIEKLPKFARWGSFVMKRNNSTKMRKFFFMRMKRKIRGLMSNWFLEVMKVRWGGYGRIFVFLSCDLALWHIPRTTLIMAKCCSTRQRREHGLFIQSWVGFLRVFLCVCFFVSFCQSRGLCVVRGLLLQEHPLGRH